MKRSIPTKLVGLLLAGICCLLIGATTAVASGPGLSSHAGDHDFVFPHEDGIKLTSVVEHVRLAWKHEIHTGFVKGGSGTVLDVLEAGHRPAYGEAASPLLVDGVLLVSWSRPSGEVSARLDSIKHRYFRNDEVNQKFLGNYFLIDADWHTLALDAKTGKKLWHRVEPSASLNFLSNKRDHNGITGAAGQGVYVTLSMLGEVFAYDLKTGEKKWSTKLDAWNKRAQAFKDEQLEKKELPYLSSAPFGHKRSGAIIVDDVVILPDLQGGLIGVSLADGKQLWHTPDRLHHQATPRPWKHDGKTWLICNDASGGAGHIHLVDPKTGETKWSHETGANPGQLLMGDGYLMLNENPKEKETAYLSCYTISLDGLTRQWQFKEDVAHGMELRPDFGAHRKGVIRQGILYAKLGVAKSGARVASIDLASGKEIHVVSDPSLGLNVGQPFIAEDKLYFHLNSAHSGGGSGLAIYQLADKGVFSYVGKVMFQGFGFRQVTSYQYPIQTPYAGGMLYMRGRTEIVAIDLTVMDDPMAEMELIGVWAGFHRPVKAKLFANDDHQIQTGRVESPPRNELGIVGTPVHREDSWTPFLLPDTAKLGDAFEVDAEISFIPFSWPIKLKMNPADGKTWTGTWTRQFPGWEKTVTRDGTLHESSIGGYDQRGWPTGWLKDQPVTFFSELPKGQHRAFLQMHDFTPPIPGGRSPQNMTLCLDYDREKVVAGIGGAFSYNQSYHEIVTDNLTVTQKGIQGTALFILNPDNWVPGDHVNGGSLAGQLKLDLTFGKPDKDGLYPVTGSWSVTWGEKISRSGQVNADLMNLKTTR